MLLAYTCTCARCNAMHAAGLQIVLGEQQQHQHAPVTAPAIMDQAVLGPMIIPCPMYPADGCRTQPQAVAAGRCSQSNTLSTLRGDGVEEDEQKRRNRGTRKT